MTSTIHTPREVDSNASDTLKREPVHLPFLDGIRAIMALWVASGHAFQDFIHVVDNHNGNTMFLPEPVFQQAFFAHFAVDVFIVLSGFCLMLPVARTPKLTLSGGWQNYLDRRARRILPPYYVALLLAGALSYLRWQLTNPGPEAIAIHLIDFRPTAIIAHLLLVQNFWDPWARALDGPTWSVATEFQIYLLFPFLLLPLWRRLKPVWVVLIASLLGVALFLFTPYGLPSCSWYLGLFAMGMLAAECYTRGTFRRMQSHLLPIGLWLLTLGWCLVAFAGWMPILMWALDLIFGVATAMLLAHWALQPTWQSDTVKNVLQWPPLVALGTFSYSFYLIHAPLLYVPTTWLLIYRANGYVGGTVIAISLLVIIGIARIFYQFVELPCIPKRRESARSIRG